MSEVPALSVRGITMDFSIYPRPMDLALEVLTRRPRHTNFRALDDISFDVEKGEVLGIIGPNGAGKSTLLKIITGVLTPSAGHFSVNGRITAILELGLGYNPEYSGRENIFLSGLLYGMEHREIEKKLDSIIDFSGLKEFIDRPVKTYSSGMHSRLAFSIATAVDPDILVIDEALAAGDGMFLYKSLRRIRELCSGGRTVILVSHGTGILAQLCRRAIWLDRGQIHMIGPALDVIQAYDLSVHQSADSKSWIEEVPAQSLSAVADDSSISFPMPCDGIEPQIKADDTQPTSATQRLFRRGPVFIDQVELLNHLGEPSVSLTALHPFSIKVRYHVQGDIPEETLGIALAINQETDLMPVAQFFTQNIRCDETRETYRESPWRTTAHADGEMTLEFSSALLRAGRYIFSIGLLKNQPGNWEFFEYRHLFYRFSVNDAGMGIGAPVFIEPTRLLNEAWTGPCSPAQQIYKQLQIRVPECEHIANPVRLRQEVESICFAADPSLNNWQVHHQCPACEAHDVKYIFSKHHFIHMRCQRCGLVFINPYPSAEMLSQLYNGHYCSQLRNLHEVDRAIKEKKSSSFSAPIILLEEIINHVSHHAEHGHWLDIGGGMGQFMQMVREKIPSCKVSIQELHSNSVHLARELFDIELHGCSIEELVSAGRCYDIVSQIAVLEHIARPHEFLLQCLSLVRPGGLMIIAIPQFTDLNALVSRSSSPNSAPPFHLSLFKRDCLLQLLTRLPETSVLHTAEHGGPAFSLMQHECFAEDWDVSIPDTIHPEPYSIQLTPYPREKQLRLNALYQADQVCHEFFNEHDGHFFIWAVVQKN